MKICKLVLLIDRYSDTEESFIFTVEKDELTMYNLFEPMLAIKQSQYQYSPCFGEVDKADLFISYKYPDKSSGKIVWLYNFSNAG